MKVILKKYLWLWEFIGVAIILGVGLVSKLVPSVLYFIIGASFVIIGLLRIIPLLKTTADKLLRWIYTGEIFINVIVGAILIVFAINKDDLNSILGYLVGGVLYLRAFIFFFGTTLRKESADWLAFIVHIGLITVGTVIIANGGFTASELGWVILAISVIAAFYIGYSGYNNYRNYRNEYAAKQITKRMKTEATLETPTSDEIISDDINIDKPNIEDQKNETEINA